MNQTRTFYRAIKVLMALSVIWSVFFYIMLLCGRSYNASLNIVSNWQQLLYSIILSIICLLLYQKAGEQDVLRTAGLALLCWSMGQLYWLSYIIIGMGDIPYPSIPDLGFLGSYFFFISLLKKEEARLFSNLSSEPVFPGLIAVIIFLGTAVILFNYGELGFPLLYSVIFTAILSYTLFCALKIKPWQNINSPGIGIIVLVAADLLLIVQIAVNSAANLLIADPLYALAFSLITLKAVSST